jgi:MFS family permease
MFRTYFPTGRIKSLTNVKVSYYLSTVLNQVGITSVTNQTMINGFLQLWNLILAVISANLVDRCGRRMLFMVSGVGMLVTYILITAISGSFANTGNSSTGLALVSDYSTTLQLIAPLLTFYYRFHSSTYTMVFTTSPLHLF